MTSSWRRADRYCFVYICQVFIVRVYANMSDIEHITTTQERLADENKPDTLQKHTEQETNHGAWMSEPRHWTETELDRSVGIQTPYMCSAHTTRERKSVWPERIGNRNVKTVGVSGLCRQTKNKPDRSDRTWTKRTLWTLWIRIFNCVKPDSQYKTARLFAHVIDSPPQTP